MKNWIYIIMISLLVACNSENDRGGGVDVGQTGSISKFTIVDNYLYVVADAKLHSFYINGNDFINAGSISIQSGVETITSLGTHLFLGSTSGMYIYSLDANPAEPKYISRFNHARVCDPVVIASDFAYVTLRSGTNCGGELNQLNILKIDSLTSPRLLNSFPMENPFGLGVVDNLLFVCEGVYGIKVFDRSSPDTLVLIKSYPEFDAYDVIVKPDQIIVMGERSIYQLDYSIPDDLTLISKIQY